MMIDFIYLKKSGLYTRFAKKYSKINQPISYYLHHTPVIEKGFTVLHLMQILTQVAEVSLPSVKIMLIYVFEVIFCACFHVGVHSNFTFMLL